MFILNRPVVTGGTDARSQHNPVVTARGGARLLRDPQALPRRGVVRTYVRAGVPEAWLDRLALILLAGAAGLIAGVFWAPLGIAAAFAVACYFAVAVAFHLRAGDAEHLPTPALLALIAAVALGLRLASA